jgi:hypothetical protein
MQLKVAAFLDMMPRSLVEILKMGGRINLYRTVF